MTAERVAYFREPVIVGYFDPEKAAEIASDVYGLGSGRSDVILGDFELEEESGLYVPKPADVDDPLTTYPMIWDRTIIGLEHALDLRFTDEINDVGFDKMNLKATAVSRADDLERRNARASQVLFRDGVKRQVSARPETLAHFDQSDYTAYPGKPARIMFGSTDKQIQMVHGSIPLPDGYSLDVVEDLIALPERCEIDEAIDDAVANKSAYIFPVEAGQLVAMIDPLVHWRGDQELVDEHRLVLKAFLDDRGPLFKVIQ